MVGDQVLSTSHGNFFLEAKDFFSLCVFLTLSSFPLTTQALSWKKITGSYRGGFVEFTYDTTWTVPTGVKTINVTVIGAGGGSGYISSGGGGGGGSCIMQGATVLVSANGGNGGDAGLKAGNSGTTTNMTLAVTSGQTLNIYVGGGGDVGLHPSSSQRGGSGGYGFCGSGGSGGKGDNNVPGGLGGLNKGGGQGGGDGFSFTIPDATGDSATSSTGAGSGGSATTPGAVGGGASGGAGAATNYFSAIRYPATYASGKCSGCPESLLPGTGGSNIGDIFFNIYGGAGGAVQISW